MMTLGKGIGGGVPLGALLATSEASCFQHGDQGGTYCGNPLMCAAGLAVLREVSGHSFLSAVQARGRHLRRLLEEISGKHRLGEVRGHGLLLALDLKLPIGPAIVTKALENRLLINSPQPDSLRFMPSLVISDLEIDEMGEILDGVLTGLVEIQPAKSPI